MPTCEYCDKFYESLQGMRLHKTRFCDKRPKDEVEESDPVEDSAFDSFTETQKLVLEREAGRALTDLTGEQFQALVAAVKRERGNRF